jgi:hypothetical protein
MSVLQKLSKWISGQAAVFSRQIMAKHIFGVSSMYGKN